MSFCCSVLYRRCEIMIFSNLHTDSRETRYIRGACIDTNGRYRTIFKWRRIIIITSIKSQLGVLIETGRQIWVNPFCLCMMAGLLIFMLKSPETLLWGRLIEFLSRTCLTPWTHCCVVDSTPKSQMTFYSGLWTCPRQFFKWTHQIQISPNFIQRFLCAIAASIYKTNSLQQHCYLASHSYPSSISAICPVCVAS